jgi:hypothetical protein
VALQCAFIYDVYIFEQWRNWVMPCAVLVVMVVSIAYAAKGTLSWLFLEFTVGSVGCLIFATIRNALLHRLGAHFVTVMHGIIELFLIADVVALNVRIFGDSWNASCNLKHLLDTWQLEAGESR